MAFYSRPVGDGGLRRSSPLTWVSSFRGANARLCSLTRPGGDGASGGSLRSSRQAVACHPFTRSWATMPPETPPPPGLLPPPGLSRWFSVTCAFLNQILALHLVGWRDAATLRFCKGLICKWLSKRGVETWPKNGCVSTPLLNCYLIISELRIRPWPRPDWFVFYIQLYSYITL